ncbi:MAG: hypothetical protein ABW046_06100 [Actinoplanes sp.]
MIDTGVQAWQISILVTAAIVLAEAGVSAMLSRRHADDLMRKRIRTGLLGLLLVLTVTVFVAALGTTLADQLSSVAAAVAAVVALWLTYRSYQSTREPPPAPPEPPAPPVPVAPVSAPAPPLPRPRRPRRRWLKRRKTGV